MRQIHETMKQTHRACRLMAGTALVAACCALAPAASEAGDVNALLMKAIGTTDNPGPVVSEAFRRAAVDLTPEQRALALKCWKASVCETGHGSLTVAYADGFGENVWRQVTKMEFIAQALTYPDVKKIVYTSAGGDAAKAVSDMRAYIAQKVDVIVIFADSGAALLPTVREATAAGIVVTVHNGTDVGGKAGKDYVTNVAENICNLGAGFVKIVAANSSKNPTTVVELGGTPGNPLSAAWQKCADDEIGKHASLKLLGKADTNWTQEGSFEAMSGFLSQDGAVDSVVYEYADGFRGGLRAYQAANKAPKLIVALRTDEQGLFCDWEKINDADFKIFYSSGQN
jgi:ribose transport system substrate-binding protein